MMIAQLLADPFLIFGGLGLVSGLVALLLSIFWLWMLIDALTNNSIRGTEKLIWVLVIIFTHFLGALIYFLVARGGRATPIV
jgi:hypothetical protein